MNQKELISKLEKYERFVDSMNNVSHLYISKFPELVNKIKELRINRPNIEKVILELDPNTDDLDLQTKQLVTKVWRVAAKLTHPDNGGDPALFHFCRILYKANDLRMLNGIVQSLQNGTSPIVSTLDSMYEVQKAKFSYQILKLHMKGETTKCMNLTRKYMEDTIRKLQNLTFQE